MAYEGRGPGTRRAAAIPKTGRRCPCKGQHFWARHDPTPGACPPQPQTDPPTMAALMRPGYRPSVQVLSWRLRPRGSGKCSASYAVNQRYSEWGPSAPRPS